MADFLINVFLDAEKTKMIEGAELADQITEIGGKKAVQVKMTEKDKKKLLKAYAGLEFDASNACVLPADAEKILMDIVVGAKSLDVMKAAIIKLANPLKGRDVFGRGSTGGR